MSDKFITIATYRNIVDGDLIRLALESDGISCFIPDEQASSMYDFCASFRLQVQATDVERAIDILQQKGISTLAHSTASGHATPNDIYAIQDRFYGESTGANEGKMVTQPMKYPFTVAEYERMGETGFFHEDDRVELIEGEIITMTPIGDRHAGTVDYLTYIFSKKLQDRALVHVQNPVRLDRYSEPQPDIVLLKPKESFYRDGHPQPDDIFLIIEVTASSADYDRDVKVPLYAKNGVCEFWIVDLEKRIVETYREPVNGEYQNRKTYTPGDSLASESFPELQIGVSDILG